MLSALYIFSMAVSFTNILNGEVVSFYLKYIVALCWCVMWVLDVLRKNKIQKVTLFVIKKYCFPVVLIAVWSFIVWILDKPLGLSSSYISRMIGNVIYLLLTYITAISGAHFFKEKVIKLSVIAMFLSILFNLFVVIGQYGINTFFSYIPNVFNTLEYQYGSRMYNFSAALEVQDITMASGLYLIYFIFFDEYDSKKTKMIYIFMTLFCAIIGFKRTTMVGILIVCLIIWLIKIKGVPFKYILYIVAIPIIIVAFVYIIMIKMDTFVNFLMRYEIDANGRVSIYRTLSKYYEISVFYLGKGFMYVDKSMYESIGFVAHSVIVKMFAEIGFIPFFLWIYHYLINIPKKINLKYGNKVGELSIVTMIYIFITYFMENTMTLFCVQYSFLMIPIVKIISEEKRKGAEDERK